MFRWYTEGGSQPLSLIGAILPQASGKTRRACRLDTWHPPLAFRRRGPCARTRPCDGADMMRNNRLELSVTVASIAGVAVFLALLRYRSVMGPEDVYRLVPLALLIVLPVAAVCWAFARAARNVCLIGERLDELCKAHGIAGVHLRGGRHLFHVPQHLAEIVRLVAAKMHELDQQALLAETASRLLSYKYDKSEAVLEAMPDAVLVLDHACVATFANSKVESLLGVSRQQLIRNPPQTWCADKDVRALLMRFTHATDSAVHTESIEYSPPGNKDRRIRVSAYPLFSPHDRSTLFGTLIVFRDITQEHVSRRAGAEFVAHVSHELKTPLATLAAYSELLMDFQELEETERVNAVNVIRDEVERATVLIINLLNISRLETGAVQLSRQRVKMYDLLRDSVQNMSRTAGKKGVSLELEVLPDLGSARLDKELFRILVDNLLSNAVKYSDAGGRVTLSAEYLEDQRMRITVEDRGIGMAEADCAKVFDKYYRSSSEHASTRGGHGLGLYLAKQIVDLHHGAISVSSELGRGTKFTIEFEAQIPQLEEMQTV